MDWCWVWEIFRSLGYDMGGLLRDYGCLVDWGTPPDPGRDTLWPS